MSAGENPTNIIMAGATNNLFGLTGVKMVTEVAGRLIISQPGAPIHYQIVRFCVVIVIKAPEVMGDSPFLFLN